MVRYVLHRVVRTLTVVLSVTLLLYAVVELVPGAVEEAVCGDGGCPSPVYGELDAAFGLDDGVAERASRVIVSLLTLDLGVSLSEGEPVRQVLRRGAGGSATVVLLALVLLVALLLTVAVVNVWVRGSWLEVSTTTLSVVSLAFPLFWTALVLRTVVGGPGNALLPAAALAFAGAGFGVRETHDRVRFGLDSRHVLLPRLYGVDARRTVLRHGLRPAVAPAFTSLAGAAAVLLGGLVLVEPTFGRSGIGTTVATAIVRRDTPVLLGGVFVLLVGFAVIRSTFLVLARAVDVGQVDVSSSVGARGGDDALGKSAS